MTKSATYTNRILREAGVTTRGKDGAKRLPSVLQRLRRENDEQREEISQLRKTKGYLEMENAIIRGQLKKFEDAVAAASERRLIDYQQMTARRNGECR